MIYPVTWPLWPVSGESESEGCLDGGTFVNGQAEFDEDANIENVCDYPVFFDILIVAGGGGGGGGGNNIVGGGGGAGGVIGATAGNPVRAFILPGQIIPATIGEGGVANTKGGDSIFWLDATTGTALDPLTDTPPAEFHALGGGEGGSGTRAAGSGGSGGGGGNDLPISGGDTSSGGGADSSQGSIGGKGVSGGGLATCQRAAGGGGGSIASQGGDGSVGSPSEGGLGGASFFLSGWGITLGGGGSGGRADEPAGSGEGVCGPSSAVEGVPGGGVGAGGGGGAMNRSASKGLKGIIAIGGVSYSRKMDQISSGKFLGWIGGGDGRMDAFDTTDWTPNTGSLSLDGNGNLVLSASSATRVNYTGTTVNEAEMMVQMDFVVPSSREHAGLVALWTESPFAGLHSIFNQFNGDFNLREYASGSGTVLDYFNGSGNTTRRSTALWGDDTDAAAIIEGSPTSTSGTQSTGSHTGTFGFQFATGMTVYRFTASTSRYITISGLEVDWVIKVLDENGNLVTSVTATGSSEDIDLFSTTLLPFGYIIVYDTDGTTPISAIGPTGGIWGGDVYEVGPEL